ncbi:DUF531 domain-containing protein [Archaeoglobus veneficus]|uniref:DUF531 domain-containing protein n=1 Tax=Archaeoglobus veneficus (strain DSM 11195 / SNP6) TaxID=693661 RepID=F2KRN4_ARCVS|nr:DUF531 domain-containing protein [Archaeoglobus veneficus]AEA46799.1 protein of unknown function DUF531 [Archaeoglobus veneficus SNP6]
MFVLCLVNTYDKLKLHEIHLRSIARAAPLCYAFGLHLALLDFPFWKERDEVVKAVRDYTTIGEHGRYLEELDKSGKFHLIEKIPAHFGVLVATTSKPDEGKRISTDDVPSLTSATFLMGLGRKGLPKELMKKAKYHWDVTGKGVSLETCAAMGVIAALVGCKHGGHKDLPDSRILQGRKL